LRVAPPNLRRFDRTSLLADQNQQVSISGLPDASALQGFANNFSIGQNSLAEKSSFVGETTFSTTQISSGQISLVQVGSTQVGSTQVGSTQVGSTQVGSTQVGSTQVGSHQNHSSQIGFVQVASHQQSFTQVNVAEVKAAEVFLDQIRRREVPDTLRILLDEGLPVHNMFSLSVGDFEHNMISGYQPYLTFLDTIDIDFVVHDLPTGQLAVRAALR
jgi:hypothetical protein